MPAAAARIEDDAAYDTMKITRAGTARVCDFAFELARQRKAQGRRGHVTNVDKANVFVSMAFWRRIFDERAARFPDISTEHAYVDAMALNLVMKPWTYDVLVTENMFGDILSDLIAALVGGMGMAPSADIGDHHALFQPAHGTAPDIAGQGIANPTRDDPVGGDDARLAGAAPRRRGAGRRRARHRGGVAAAPSPAARVRPREFGGRSGTAEIARAVHRAARVTDRIAMVGAGYFAQFQLEGWRDAGAPVVGAVRPRPGARAGAGASASACRGASPTPPPMFDARAADAGRRRAAAGGAGGGGARGARARHCRPSARSRSAPTWRRRRR